MDLVERDEPLATLRELVAGARRGHGSVVVVAAEAGLGKTTLLRAAAEQARTAGAAVRWGVCDPFAAPRPLGPLWDVAAADPSLGELLHGSTDRFELFSGVLDRLSRPGPPVLLVLEDLHWGDDATLDLVRYLARRAAGTRAVVAASLRDDDPGPAVRALLGDLATTPDVHRVGVGPLSVDGVRQLLADAPVDPVQAHRMTGGNAFYVSELARTREWVLPPTVAEAVRARVARLPPSAQDLLATVAAAPGGLELPVATALHPAADAVDPCLDAAVLELGPSRLTFRHEIARLAVWDSLGDGGRRRTSARLLQALEDAGASDHARLADLARAAGDGAGVLDHARAAGAAAAARGAHRAAAEHYRAAVGVGDGLPPAERADLLEAWAVQRRSIDGEAALLPLWEEVVALFTEAGQAGRTARARMLHSAAVWATGDAGRAHLLADAAIDALGRSPEAAGADLAFCCAHRASLAMLARDRDGALRWGRRALELADLAKDPVSTTHALNGVGATLIVFHDDVDQPPEEGISHLRRCHALAVQAGVDSRATGAILNLGSGLGEIRSYELADAALREVLERARARDQDRDAGYAVAWLARTAMETGRWDDAVGRAAEALELEHLTPIIPIVARTARARVAIRRGDGGHGEDLDVATRLADRTGDLQRTWPAATARAEALWLADGVHPDGFRSAETRAHVLDAVAGPLAEARRLQLPWAVGELGWWASRADPSSVTAADLAVASLPYRLQLEGDLSGAAEVWARVGCPYEEALCRAAGEETEQLRALAVLDRLGAEPVADRVRSELRASGTANVPPRPRGTSRSAPAGLTARQLDVLALLAGGASNAEIARRLFISEKTAGHHVSAVLAKLDVARRGEAAAAAHRLGIGGR